MLRLSSAPQLLHARGTPTFQVIREAGGDVQRRQQLSVCWMGAADPLQLSQRCC